MPSTSDAAASPAKAPLIEVKGLRMAFGRRLIQKDISFTVDAGTIFTIMGGSGCGKSTLLKHMLGLLTPASGTICYEGVDFFAATDEQRNQIRTKLGVLFQGSALWSSMTLLENVRLPLERAKICSEDEIDGRAREALKLVDLAKFADFLPSDISGGMKKRAGLARAIAVKPPMLFLDEPSAGLDPVSAKRLDELILAIRDQTHAAVMIVTHELPSIFAIADDSIFLDAESKQPIGHGKPTDLRDHSDHPFVHAFLRREVPPESSDNARVEAA
ncbi:ATP-binding cassette domain-containing protein [soil metagenome]